MLFNCLLLIISLLGSDISSYRGSENQYVVLVLIDGISVGEAKRMARERAAEQTVGQGARYFTIDSETQVKVLKADRPEEIPPTNLQNELIIEGDFGKGRVERESPVMTRGYSAIRLVFTIHQEKPFGRGVDACDYTNCNYSDLN